MNLPKTKRVYKLKIYLKDTPVPSFHTIKQMFTEGAMLRLMNEEMESIWYPLCNIDKIIEEQKLEVEDSMTQVYAVVRFDEENNKPEFDDRFKGE